MGCNWVLTDLRKANLGRCDIDGGDFFQTNLKSAKVFFSQEANFYKTILPNGDVVEGLNYYPWSPRPGDFTNCLREHN